MGAHGLREAEPSAAGRCSLSAGHGSELLAARHRRDGPSAAGQNGSTHDRGRPPCSGVPRSAQCIALRSARAARAGSVAPRTALCTAAPVLRGSDCRRAGVMPPSAKHGVGAASRARRANPSGPSAGRVSVGFEPGG